MSETKLSYPRKIMAAICHHCPFCRAARKNPNSVVGKILHHKMHADHCPFWKAEIAAYGRETSPRPLDEGN